VGYKSRPVNTLYASLVVSDTLPEWNGVLTENRLRSGTYPFRGYREVRTFILQTRGHFHVLPTALGCKESSFRVQSCEGEATVRHVICILKRQLYNILIIIMHVQAVKRSKGQIKHIKGQFRLEFRAARQRLL
jgi:hypothetical protein